MRSKVTLVNIIKKRIQVSKECLDTCNSINGPEQEANPSVAITVAIQDGIAMDSPGGPGSSVPQ